ncbi:hypothetical protein B840_10040 [Corynebacterium marinum DSM 44953]|uniref:HTH-like domain-containing protein n=1 Tax=Corynebacterium marinum DSM 44953 TaxID=1224162 RepID=A0A0B6TNT3_9CORY|nr:hypothetical protein B840_10040 [Corynebacterium marinum DSM 44953]GGO22593.1 hypothetical protein GCM10010980_24750 [Corynebacterium marinum]
MIRFQFVDDTRHDHPVKRMCEIPELNRTSYYKWKSSLPARRKRLVSDAILGARVKTIFAAERGCYGAKRITAELNDQPEDLKVNHKRVARIMRSLKLVGYTRKRKVTTTVADKTKTVFLDPGGPEIHRVEAEPNLRRRYHLPADCRWIQYVPRDRH